METGLAFTDEHGCAYVLAPLPAAMVARGATRTVSVDSEGNWSIDVCVPPPDPEA